MAQPDGSQVVFRSLQQFALMLRDAVVVQHNLDCAPSAFSPGERPLGRRLGHVVLDGGTTLVSRPINGQIHLSVLGSHAELTRRTEVHDDLATVAAGLVSTDPRLEMNINELNAEGKRTQRLQQPGLHANAQLGWEFKTVNVYVDSHADCPRSTCSAHGSLHDVVNLENAPGTPAVRTRRPGPSSRARAVTIHHETCAFKLKWFLAQSKRCEISLSLQ